MHAHANNGSAVTTDGNYQSFIEEADGGVRIRSNQTDYARLDEASGTFVHTTNPSEAAVYNFAVATTGSDIYIWLDGTWGGLDYLTGSDDTMFTATQGGKIILPTEWKTPDRYHYRVKGWYDVVDKKYYAPGDEVTVTKNTVFYPDWVPYTYDIGQYNAKASNTVSTSEFVTTRVFDFSPFYNLQYSTARVTVNNRDHSESWTLDDKTKFVFRNNDTGTLAAPSGSTDQRTPNQYTNADPNQGLWNEQVAQEIFGTETEVIGKNYLGTGDHLFQYCDDPANTEYYGYYYYDSDYHAASYNQSGQRFYVYDYLSSAEGNAASAFLPLNSPDVNTNGQTVRTYSYDGEYGEYAGTTHYEYSDNSGVNSEYWFGIQTDIRFYLSNTPGEKDADGNTVNRGVNGEELVFNFTGDDDVWVFVDGQLVLDIGGIHQAVDGSINFSTGDVIVDGKTQANVRYLGPGDHVLTMYYLERGGGGSNCKVKFNISARYGLKLLKEDILTREMLNGAEFTVYTNENCTIEADLWSSHAAYEAGETPRSTFAVVDGEANFWGLAAGNTYYIKETKYPDNGSYGVANGIIVMKLNSQGQATFDVIADENSGGNNLSGGFTVHGFKIDVENHEALLVATNSKEEYSDEVTSVTAVKKWGDTKDHSNDSVTVYILANGFRIQEATLNEANNWTHTWKNLLVESSPGVPVVYTVEEGTVSGYFGTVTPLETSEIEITEWKQTNTVTSGETYLLGTSQGYLSASKEKFSWITDKSTAEGSPEAKWVITQNGSNYYFTNEAGQSIYYGSDIFNASSSNRTALAFSGGKMSITSGNGPNRKTYYPSGINNSGKLSRTSSSGSALVFTLYLEETKTETITVEGLGFLITNEPITEENSVSFKVTKKWNTGGFVTQQAYEQFQIPFRLYADDDYTGMEVIVNLKGEWTYTFKDLPKYNKNKQEINYTVREEWTHRDWESSYGEITKTGNVYEQTVTNSYIIRYELPKTGGSGNLIGIIGGILVMIAGPPLVYTNLRKKRGKEDTS